MKFEGNTPPSFGGDTVFRDCLKLSAILVPEGSETAYKTALENNNAQGQIKVYKTGAHVMHDLDALIQGYALPQPAAPAAPADQPQTGSLPQTGDSSSLALWLCLLAFAGAGMTAMRKREA